MTRDNRHQITKNVMRILVIMICIVIYVPSMPVNYFTITGKGNILFSCPVPNGYSFETVYIHSLERTPVRDDYRFVSGKIWNWEEWTKSLNAGLPSVIPQGTKLIMTPEWMIMRGSRRTMDVIYYRVGTEIFGRNIWNIEPWEEISIFEKYPMYRMSFEASAVPFKFAAITGFDTIHNN